MEIGLNQKIVNFNYLEDVKKRGVGRKKKTRKKRGAVKFGKNKTTAEILEVGRKYYKLLRRKRKEKCANKK